jgi:DUF438 domain-containing protein
MEAAWLKELEIDITICDRNGVIVFLNDKSENSLKKYGGQELIGKNLLDCHNETSREKIIQMLEAHTENIYSIEKNGKKKLIIQKPLYNKSEYDGIIELGVEIPKDMPYFIRD